MQGLEIRDALFLLQLFQVAFLLLHDWIPLGRLNDIAAVRRENSRQEWKSARPFEGHTRIWFGFPLVAM